MNCLHCGEKIKGFGKWCPDKPDCRKVAVATRKENCRTAYLRYSRSPRGRAKAKNRYRVWMTKKYCDGCGEFVKINGRWCDKLGCQDMKKDIEVNGWEYYDRGRGGVLMKKVGVVNAKD